LLKVPPLNSSVSPLDTLHVPLPVPPPSKFRVVAVALLLVTVPLLLKVGTIMVVPVPPVFSKVPVLLNVALLLQHGMLSTVSFWKFHVPALFTTAPPVIYMFRVPAPVIDTVAPEGMLNVPALSVGLFGFGTEIPPLAVVVPLALSVPPAKVNRLERVNELTEPDRVPAEKFTGPVMTVGLV
jgi:hypothetical protein